MENLRKIEVLENGSWRSANMIDLRKGNVFRVFESNNEPVIVGDKVEFIAENDSYYNENNIATVTINYGNYLYL